MTDDEKPNKQEKKPPSPHYEVGYGRPPKSAQFRKGQSGNPSGKRKAPQAETLDVGAIALKVYSEMVWVVINGQRVRVTRLEALLIGVLERGIRTDRGARLALDGLHLLPQLPAPGLKTSDRAELQRKIEEMARRYRESQGLDPEPLEGAG